MHKGARLLLPSCDIEMSIKGKTKILVNIGVIHWTVHKRAHNGLLCMESKVYF